MRHSEQIDQLATAMAQAQGELGHAKMDRENPYFKSRYATLKSVIDSSKPILAKHGLAVVQTFSSSEDGKPVVHTTLMHKSGQWMSGELTLNPGKTDPQSVGSAITYGRRYGHSAIVGIVADEDDDGNAASEPDASKLEHKPEPKRKTKVKTGDAPPQDDTLISKAQVKLLFATIGKINVDPMAVKTWLKETYGIEHSDKIRKADFDAVIEAMTKRFDDLPQ